MKALCIVDRALRLSERPTPSPAPDEVLIRVVASGLNRADLLQVKGRYPAPQGAPSEIPGLEYAGEVVRCGARVQRLEPGMAVMGIAAGGAHAEYLTVHERETIGIPPGVPLVEAAAIPEAFGTAYDALVRQAKLKTGERLLVHAAGSGVGTAALQLARALRVTAIGTSRTPSKVERLEGLGATHGLLLEGRPPRFAERIRELIGGVDVCLELVGGAQLGESVAAMAPGGRIVLLGLLGGATSELPLGLLLQRRLSLQGSVLRSRPLEEKIALARELDRHLLPLFDGGGLGPTVDETFAAPDFAEAFERMANDDNFGKLLLRW